MQLLATYFPGKVPYVLHHRPPVFVKMSCDGKRAKLNLFFDFLFFLKNHSTAWGHKCESHFFEIKPSFVSRKSFNFITRHSHDIIPSNYFHHMESITELHFQLIFMKRARTANSYTTSISVHKKTSVLELILVSWVRRLVVNFGKRFRASLEKRKYKQLVVINWPPLPISDNVFTILIK